MSDTPNAKVGKDIVRTPSTQICVEWICPILLTQICVGKDIVRTPSTQICVERICPILLPRKSGWNGYSPYSYHANLCWNGYSPYS